MSVSAYQSRHQRWTQLFRLLQPEVVQFLAEISPVLNLPDHQTTKVQKAKQTKSNKYSNI